MFTVIINLILTIFFVSGHGAAVFNPDATLLTLKPDAPAAALAADKGAVLAAHDHYFLFLKNADASQPIASITKLMTALVFLDNNPGWNKVYQITAADNVSGGRLNLFLGDRVTLRDLFYTSLVASDNGATLALVHATGLSEEAFVTKMNERAKTLGLLQTHFKDPIGLSDDNVATAREVALLAQAALSRPEIRDATTKSEYRFTTLDGRDKLIESTDYLLLNPGPSSFQVLGGKTGYTDQAGYCFVGWFKDVSGGEFIAAVLNAAGKNDRFLESRNLVNWVVNNYDWRLKPLSSY